MPSRGRIIKDGWYAQMRRGITIYCALCGDPISPGGDKGLGSVTVDHIIPKSCGGTYRMDNVQPAHQKCNNIKGNIDIGEAVRDPRDENRRLAILFGCGLVLWFLFYTYIKLWSEGKLP